ncbi:hypothetical protein SE939_00005, partial [Legionella pneumophila]|nr:hypothetical protein [Legionella pneumophila]MDW9098144.1 hypothetical protein [Legionella pneumophila]
ESFLTPLIESFPPPEFILLKKTIVGGSIFSRQRGSVYIQQRQIKPTYQILPISGRRKAGFI